MGVIFPSSILYEKYGRYEINTVSLAVRFVYERNEMRGLVLAEFRKMFRAVNPFVLPLDRRVVTGASRVVRKCGASGPNPARPPSRPRWRKIVPVIGTLSGPAAIHARCNTNSRPYYGTFTKRRLISVNDARSKNVKSVPDGSFDYICSSTANIFGKP